MFQPLSPGGAVRVLVAGCFATAALVYSKAYLAKDAKTHAREPKAEYLLKMEK